MAVGSRNPAVGSGGGGTNNYYTTTEIISGVTMNIVDASAGEVVLTLPSAGANANSTYKIYKADSSANRVIVTGTDPIYGDTILTKQYESLHMTSDSTSWWGVTQQESGVNVRVFGATGNGTDDDRAAVNTAAGIAAGNNLIFPAGTYRLSSNLTLDENLVPHKGAIFSLDFGVVLTISGTITAGRYQIFSGLGSVLITGSMDYVYPEWRGGIPDGVTDCTAAIQSALDCGDIPVSLAKGTYLVNGHILLDTNDQIIGTGDQSLIQIKSEATGTIRLFDIVDSVAYLLENIRLQNFRINGSGDVRTDAALATPAILLANCDNVLIEGLTIENMHQGGIFLGWDYNTEHIICSNVKIINNTFKILGYQGSYTSEAIVIGAGEKILIQGNTISDCRGIGGINLEANKNGIRDVRIIGNSISDVKTWGILVQVNGGTGSNRTTCQNIIIQGNYIHSSYFGIQVKYGATPALPENIIIKGNIVDGGTAFSRGINNTDVEIRGFSYRISSTKYWHDVVYDQALPAGNIPVGLWGIYTYQIGTDGAIDVTGDNNGDTGYDTEVLAIAALAATSADHVRMGYVTVQAPAASAFVPGTTALYGTGGTQAQKTNFYPLPMSDKSGIYACNAMVSDNIVQSHTVGIALVYNSDAYSNTIRYCETGIQAALVTAPYPPDITSVSYLILGNSIKDSARLDNVTLYGIYFCNASARGIIRDNMIEDRNPSPSMAYGIYCKTSGTNNLDIGNNYIYGAQTQEIFSNLSLVYISQSTGSRALSGTGAFYQHFDMPTYKAFGPEDGNFMEVNPTANVNLTPYPPLFNTTYAGWWVTVRNVSVTNNFVNSDASGLNYRIYPGESASFYYTGTAWVLVYSGQIDMRAIATPTFGGLSTLKKTSLGSEGLTNPNLTGGISWSATNECALAADAATWTYVAGGASTLTQALATMVSGTVKPNRWYKFVYTVSDLTGTPTVNITTSFASATTALIMTAGAQATYFKSAAVPADFVITCTLATGQVFTLDTFSLKEVTGGNIEVYGKITGGGTNGLTIDGTGNVGINTIVPTAKLHLPAGTATVNTAPIKLTSGTVLGTPEAGAIEFNNDSLYYTKTTGPTRMAIAPLESPSFTTPNIGVATATSVSCSPTISSGAGAPGTTPAKVGDIYVDTTGKKMYAATGITNSTDWTIVN